MIKIGLVGTGGTVGIANNHYKAILKDQRACVSAVFNRHVESARKWVEDNHLDSKVCTSFDELLNEVDAVIICTPPNSHCDYAKRAVLSGKHVLLEKPMTINLEESLELKNLKQDKSIVKMVGFVYRYSTLAHEAKRIVEEKIGEVYTVSSWMGGNRLADTNVPYEWRMNKSISGNGAIGDFGSHLVDMAAFVANQKYNEVACFSDIFIRLRKDNGLDRAVETSDGAVICTKNSQGIGSFTVSRVGHEAVRMHISGKGGMLEMSFAGNGSLLFWPKHPNGAYLGICEEVPFETQIPFQGWFDLEIKDFLDAIEGKSSNYPSFEDGYYVDSVLFAAEQSSANGKTMTI